MTPPHEPITVFGQTRSVFEVMIGWNEAALLGGMRGLRFPHTRGGGPLIPRPVDK